MYGSIYDSVYDSVHGSIYGSMYVYILSTHCLEWFLWLLSQINICRFCYFSVFLVVNWCFPRFLLFFADIYRFARFCTVFNTFVLFCAFFDVFCYLLHKTKVSVGFRGIRNILSSFRWCFRSILPQFEWLVLTITFVLLFVSYLYQIKLCYVYYYV